MSSAIILSVVFIRATAEQDADGELAEYYRQQRDVWGFLPNYAAAFASRPDGARAWNALNTVIRDGMDRRRFEIATIAAARTLRSSYCTAAHSKFLRDICGDETAMRAIAGDPSGAALSEVDRAVYTFAGKVAADAASVDQGTSTRYMWSGYPTPRSPLWSSPPQHVRSSPGFWTGSARNSTSRRWGNSHPTYARR